MLEVFDKNRMKLAILQNAFNISETIRLNAIDTFIFSLPDTDPKNGFCQPFNLIKYNNGETYRIMPIANEESETGVITYECEHVIALLIDTIMFGFVNIGGLGYYTREVIQYVLNRQYRKDWVLDECDFSRQFEYGWEQENLLSALFSIPNFFTDKYIWKFNTANYPYKLSLKLIDENRNPDHYIRKGHNRLTLIKQSDPRQICTRLYPLGAGEGINQLGISEINNNLPYLQSPAEYINKYGLIERPWIDRRYTDQQSLREAAQVMLDELQEPFMEYETQFLGDCKIADIVQIVGGIKSIIIEIAIKHEEIPQTTIRIANKAKDIANSIADLADRQLIEMTYSQGATQIYADSLADNADGTTPLELRFFLPDTMINVNAVNCKIRLSQFRAYNANLISGGTSKTSSAGGGTTTSNGGSTTTSNGGSTSTTSSTTTAQSATSQSGGGGTITITSATGYDYRFTDIAKAVPHLNSHYHSFDLFPHTHEMGAHTHNFTIPGHYHNVSIGNHTHTIGDHTHTIGNHTHSVDTTHSHDITPKISFFGNPANFWLYVNGEKKMYINGKDAEIEITQYLVKEQKIPRGTWHTIGILPDTLARVEISCNITGFIQSRGNKTV